MLRQRAALGNDFIKILLIQPVFNQFTQECNLPFDPGGHLFG